MQQQKQILGNNSNNIKNKYYTQFHSKNFTVDCTKFGGLYNISSSCYLDSVLFALLAIPTKFIDDNILFKNIKRSQKVISGDTFYQDIRIRTIIQKYLVAIAHSIRSTKNIRVCTPFREVIKHCKIKGMPDFGLPGQQEAGEFLIYLLKIFNSEGLAQRKTVTLATNNLTTNVHKSQLQLSSTVTDSKASIVLFIDSFLLSDRRNSRNFIHNFLLEKQDSGKLDQDNLFRVKDALYRRRISYSMLMDAPYLIFWAQRADPITGNVLKTSIIPTKQITMKTGRILTLNAIIIHFGFVNFGHYITYFRYRNTWYLYDDIGARIEIIGDYNALMNFNPSPITNGVLYFYI